MLLIDIYWAVILSCGMICISSVYVAEIWLRAKYKMFVCDLEHRYRINGFEKDEDGNWFDLPNDADEDADDDEQPQNSFNETIQTIQVINESGYPVKINSEPSDGVYRIYITAAEPAKANKDEISSVVEKDIAGSSGVAQALSRKPLSPRQ